MPQAIIWTSAEPIHWRIYAVLGSDGLVVVVNTWFPISQKWCNETSYLKIILRLVQIGGYFSNVISNYIWQNGYQTADSILCVSITDANIHQQPPTGKQEYRL